MKQFEKDYYTSIEVQELLRISRDALRYYEERGLVHADRDRRNHRIYSTMEILRLMRIRNMRAVAYSVSEIEDQLKNGIGSRGEAERFFKAKRSEIRNEIAEMEMKLATLTAAENELRFLFEIYGTFCPCAGLIIGEASTYDHPIRGSEIARMVIPAVKTFSGIVQYPFEVRRFQIADELCAVESTQYLRGIFSLEKDDDCILERYESARAQFPEAELSEHFYLIPLVFDFGRGEETLMEYMIPFQQKMDK